LDWDQSVIGRFLNIVDQLILTIVDLNKIVIHAYSGRVLSLFLNIGLACDYRIVANNTVFQNPSLELGIVPIGGGAFFLPKMLGYRKAYEILLSGKDITAREAISLGIVDQITPLDKLEETALETAQRFSQKPVSSLAVIKRLLNYSRKDLEDYLRLENEELLRIFLSSDFRDKIMETHV
jgi:2-(1,2-epoxy-1,2-dihydrophenyl)acetyl-CoA isomerase